MLYTQTSTHIIIYTNNIITKNNAHTINNITYTLIHIIKNKMLEIQTICQIFFLQTAVVGIKLLRKNAY